MNGTLDRATVRELTSRFGSTPILVVGDVMLDHFVYGRVNRISPEAPVPIVEFDHDEYRLGGAANVAHNVRALGGLVRLIGVVGADEGRDRVAAGLQAEGLDTDGLVTDRTRPTTKKMRVVTSRNQQVARIDYEDDGELALDAERRLVEEVERAAASAGAIIVSDYLKGCVTRPVMTHVIDAARTRGTPVLVDPKMPHIDYYAGSQLVTPNHYEAEIVTHTRIRSDDDAGATARLFRERARCENVLITRSEQGMCLLEGTSGRVRHLPAVAREVADVTGAGDTVIATIGLALASGATLEFAARLANHAAGLSVGKFGPAVVTPEELIEAL